MNYLQEEESVVVSQYAHQNYGEEYKESEMVHINNRFDGILLNSLSDASEISRKGT